VIQGMSMTCPDGWHDKSMLILSAEAAGRSGVTPNMVVTRDVPPANLPDEPQARLNALIDRQVAQMAEQLAGFAEVSRRVSARGDGAVAELKVDWHNSQARLTQSITYVQDGPAGLVIATATAGRDEFAEHEPRFRDMLKSFRIDG
jgi:hypothetical protein